MMGKRCAREISKTIGGRVGMNNKFHSCGVLMDLTVIVSECEEILGRKSASQLVVTAQMFRQSVNQHDQSSAKRKKRVEN